MPYAPSGSNRNKPTNKNNFYLLFLVICERHDIVLVSVVLRRDDERDKQYLGCHISVYPWRRIKEMHGLLKDDRLGCADSCHKQAGVLVYNSGICFTLTEWNACMKSCIMKEIDHRQRH
jgi:hypothetical protein